MEDKKEESKVLILRQEEEMFAIKKIVAAKYETMDVMEVIGN